MYRAWFKRARVITSVIAALALMFLSLGVSGPAAAGQGNGKGGGAATSQKSTSHAPRTTTAAREVPHDAEDHTLVAGRHTLHGRHVRYVG
jgi:hypothetical protein